MSDKNRTTQKC